MGALGSYIFFSSDLKVCSDFLAARRAQRTGHCSRQKKKVTASLNVCISLRTSGFKEEAECCAQVVQASEHKSRQTFTTALEKIRAWP
jgi:hypothetical protein